MHDVVAQGYLMIDEQLVKACPLYVFMEDGSIFAAKESSQGQNQRTYFRVGTLPDEWIERLNEEEDDGVS